MSYRLARVADERFDLLDPNGNVVVSYQPPVRTPEDVLPDILDDLGVADSGVRSAIEIVATGSIDVVDER